MSSISQLVSNPITTHDTSYTVIHNDIVLCDICFYIIYYVCELSCVVMAAVTIIAMQDIFVK